MQSSKGEGLAGVFGGGGQTLFGGRTGDVLTKATSILGAAFMVLSLVLALISGRAPRSSLSERLQATPGQEASSALDSAGEGALEQPPAAAPASELPPAE